MTPAPQKAMDRAARRLRKIACHGIDGTLETSFGGSTRRLAVIPCFGEITRPALAYADALAAAALDAVAECKGLPRPDGALLALQNCATELHWKVTPAHAALVEATPFPSNQH